MVDVVLWGRLDNCTKSSWPHSKILEDKVFSNERLDNYTVVDSGCWIWNGSIDIEGYGRISGYPGTDRAYRAAFRDVNGYFPKHPRMVCHKNKCGNKSCINPDHLYDGSGCDNQDDASNIDSWSIKRLLDKNKVIEIQELYKSGLYSKVDLSIRFRVSRTTISRVTRGVYFCNSRTLKSHRCGQVGLASR